MTQALHFDNLQMIKEAEAHHAGVSILPGRILRDEVAQGRLVAIPMAGAVGSLNVSVAAGVCLFEARRQRLRKDQKPK